MNTIHNLSTGPHKRIQMHEGLCPDIAKGSFPVILCNLKINSVALQRAVYPSKKEYVKDETFALSNGLTECFFKSISKISV